MLLLLACHDDPAVESATTQHDSAGQGFVMPDPPAPTWDADEVSGRIEAALPFLPDPLSAQSEYIEALMQGDPECPVLFEGWSMLSALQGCTASSGWVYAGLGSWFVMEEDGDYSLGADFLITSPEGEEFLGTGIAQYMDRADDQWDIALWGQWHWPLAEGWLKDVTSLLMQIHRQGNRADFQGGWTGPYGSFYFRGLQADLDQCVTTMGEIEVRDDEGFWYALTWGGGGCAQLSYEGQPMGESCYDPGPLLCAYVDKITTLAAESQP